MNLFSLLSSRQSHLRSTKTRILLSVPEANIDWNAITDLCLLYINGIYLLSERSIHSSTLLPSSIFHPAHKMPDSNCIHVSPECPVETELYGYAPNLGANAFFTISFGLCMILHIAVGIHYHTWFFIAAPP